MSFIRFLGVTVLLAVWVCGANAQQVPVVIERLEVSLWPEYDDSRLLVIFRGELAQEPTGPLTFAIPLTADMHAAAYANSEGRLLKSDWQLLPSNEREQLVVFALGSRRFQLEYYDEILGQRPQRTFTFRFQSSRYEIKDLQIEVQQPLRSTEFVAHPPMPDNLGTDARGLRYSGRQLGATAAGMLIEQQISYLKRDDRPSVQAGTSAVLAPWWLIVAAVALMTLGLGGITWYWWERRKAQTLSEKKSLSHRPASASLRFCSGCGRAFRDEEQFCPKCGRARS